MIGTWGKSGGQMLRGTRENGAPRMAKREYAAGKVGSHAWESEETRRGKWGETDGELFDKCG